MRKLLEKVNEDLMGQAGKDYTSTVPVRFIHTDYEYEDTDLNLSYDIEVNSQIWGLSGINVYFHGIVSVEVESFETRSGNSRGMKKFTLDLNAAKIEWRPDTVCKPTDIEVYLNPDESVSRVVVNFSYINKE
jgi:hypothetical protein